MTREPRIGVGIIIRRGDEVLLLRRAGAHGVGSWSTPGGHLDHGESLEQCAAREAAEETGVEIRHPRFRAITNDVFEDEARHYLTVWMDAEYRTGDARANAPDEVAAVGWFRWDQLPTPLFLPFQNLLAGHCYPAESGAEMHEQPPPAVALLPFDPACDMQRLHAWLRRPHVARWWGDPDTALAAVRQLPAAAQAFIAVDATPVGYVCWQEPSPAELAAAGLSDLPPGLMDVDILIGEQDCLGRGFGPRALSCLLDRLRAEGRSDVGIATAAANPRALRAFEKAGFRLFRAFREDGQDYRYLVLSLAPAV